VIARTTSEGPSGGLGLVGMAERARLVGGELDVRSAPGGGTTITLRVPS
jgi:signal transduction histidine kinase